MKKRPVILVFPSKNTDQTVLNLRYSDAVYYHGGVAVPIPYKTGQDGLEQLIALADGFLFSGGVDLDPRLYGEEKLNDTVETDEERDRLEMAAIKYVMDSGKPVLGICRGIQTVNVGLGGDLYQDIPSQVMSAVSHRQSPTPGDQPTHAVNIVPGSRLNKIIGQTRIMTNSFHHQAVKAPAGCLKVSAFSDDGLTEALEYDGDRFIMLVQWHPEFTYSSDPSSSTLFSEFINAARDDKV